MIYFIVNPIAGAGKSKKSIPIIEEFMKDKNSEYEIVVTNYNEHATGLVKNAIKNNATKVIAVGGDGTVLEVVEAVKGTNIIMGILPVGTGNDTARALKIPFNINNALEVILFDKIIKCDLIAVKNHNFINIASIGMDANIVKYTEKIKKYFGKFSYFVAVIREIFISRGFRGEVKIDGKVIKGKFLLVAIANGNYYGGGFNIAPSAVINDGLIDVIVINKMPNIIMPFLLPKVVVGKHGNLKQVKMYRGKEVSIRAYDKLPINIDGNIYNYNTPLDFEINKNKISVLVP